MRPISLGIVAATALLAGGCTDDPRLANQLIDTQNEGTVDKNPQVDADPAPQTGTGGSIPLGDPDGTTNGAPAASEAPADGARPAPPSTSP